MIRALKALALASCFVSALFLSWVTFVACLPPKKLRLKPELDTAPHPFIGLGATAENDHLRDFVTGATATAPSMVITVGQTKGEQASMYDFLKKVDTAILDTTYQMPRAPFHTEWRWATTDRDRGGAVI